MDHNSVLNGQTGNTDDDDDDDDDMHILFVCLCVYLKSPPESPYKRPYPQVGPNPLVSRRDFSRCASPLYIKLNFVEIPRAQKSNSSIYSVL